MTAVVIIIVAVGGFFAYKKFFAKKKEVHTPPVSRTIKSPSIKGGGSTAPGNMSGGDPNHYTTKRG